MDEGIGNVLYIIFMLIALVVSVIKKSSGKKSQSTTTNNYEEENSSGVFSNISDLFNTPPGKDIGLKESQAQTDFSLKNVVKPGYKGGNAAFSETQLKAKSLNVEECSESFWDQNEFDLRSAVAFSEILKRPDF